MQSIQNLLDKLLKAKYHHQIVNIIIIIINTNVNHDHDDECNLQQSDIY